MFCSTSTDKNKTYFCCTYIFSYIMGEMAGFSLKNKFSTELGIYI